MKSLRYTFFLGLGICLFIVGSLLVVAQDDHDNNDTETDHELVERGYEVFTTNGCVACHGQNAEGNDIGPALAGHSEFSIRRQIRTPTGIMIAFSPAQIPAEDVDALVAYILSLEVESGGEHGDEHDMDGIATGDLIFAHHWFLWLELEMGEIDGSIHHTAHILELLTDGPHKVLMQPVLTALGEGDLETARTIIEPMITDVGEFSHDIYTVGMQLTYLAITSGDQETALHFATDLSEHDLTDDQVESVTGALELIEACEIDEAVLFIESILGEELYFIPNAMDMGDDHSDDSDMDTDDDHSDDEDMDDDHSDDSDMDTDDDHSDDEDMDDDHSDDGDMDMDNDHSDDEDMDDDHSNDGDMDMDDDHDEIDTGCGEHDEEAGSSTEEHSD